MTGSWPLNLFIILSGVTVVAATAWHLFCELTGESGANGKGTQGGDNHG